MTLGQRIAQKRKELGLSQEGLGEQLGVSRQAIYKWESDASLPEIDKLIILSKIFSVSVGWLLGVEETPSPAEPPSGELTEAQLQMVQEIVDRYLAAQPKQAPLKRWRLVRLCGAAAVLALVVALFNLFSKLDRVTQDYNNLRYSVDNVSNSVNSQINSITYRVENILKSQNSLTAEYSTALVSTDLEANTATFDIRVVPKTYVDGMTALFLARSGEETAELPVEPEEDRAFSGEITCPLTDNISLTVVFVTGDKRETQWLEDFYNLYSESFPALRIAGPLWFDERDGVLSHQMSTERDTRRGFWVLNNSDQNHRYLGWYPEPPAKLQVGLFQDRKLLLWYEGGMETTSWNGTPTEEYLWRRPQDVTLDPGHEYCEVAIYTDEYGRQRIYPGDGLTYDELEGHWMPSTTYADGLTDWDF